MAYASRAEKRQSLVDDKRMLLESTSLAVRDYFNGHEHCDLAVVAQWAGQHNQQRLLQVLQADGFQGPVPVSDLNQARNLYGMAGPRPTVALQLQHAIDSDNAGEIISLLQEGNVDVTELWLNLSSGIAANPLIELLSAVDALPGLERLEIQVDGRSKGRVEDSVLLPLAKSKACITLSATARSLILRDVPDFILRQSLAVKEFLAMEPCSESGKYLKTEFARDLAGIALRSGMEGLLYAVRVLAPDYTITTDDIILEENERKLLGKCQMPCILEVSIPLLEIKSVRKAMRDLNVARLSLSVRTGMNPRSTKLMKSRRQMKRMQKDLARIAGMRTVEELMLTTTGVSVNPHALFDGLLPSSICLDQSPGDAAMAIDSIDGKARQRLNSLTIFCGESSNPKEASALMNALEGLLKKPHVLRNVVIRSSVQPLAVSDEEIVRLKSAAEANPPTGSIRFEYLPDSSSTWQRYHHINFSLALLAEKFFFSLGLPSDIARHMVDIGALSTQDIPTLLAVSKEMHSTLSRRQSATFIVFDLTNGQHTIGSLRESLTLLGGELDQSLVDEVRRQLEKVSDSKRFREMLDAVVSPVTIDG